METALSGGAGGSQHEGGDEPLLLVAPVPSTSAASARLRATTRLRSSVRSRSKYMWKEASSSARLLGAPLGPAPKPPKPPKPAE